MSCFQENNENDYFYTILGPLPDLGQMEFFFKKVTASSIFMQKFIENGQTVQRI